MCMNFCVCVHHLDYLTWSSSTPETLAHQWQTPHAVILLVSGLILCSIHKLWFRYLILPPETELFLLALSFLPPPTPQLFLFFHLYLTPTLVSFLSPSVFIFPSVRWSVSTLVCRLSGGVLSAMEPELYWDTGDFTLAFTNSHTFGGLLANGSAVNDRITSFTLYFTEIPPGYRDNGLSQRTERGKKTILRICRAARL